MIEPELIKNTLSMWFASLDYEFMILVVVSTYGIYHSKIVQWWVKLLGGDKVLAIWKTAALLAVVEIVRNAGIEGWIGRTINTTIVIFESFVLMMVFVEDIVKLMKTWLMAMKQLKS